MVVVSSVWGSSCPKGFDDFEDECLLLSDQEMTWTEADWFCRKIDSELILLKDRESQDRLLKYDFAEKRHSFWIGGYLHSDLRWHWIDGTVDSAKNYQYE